MSLLGVFEAFWRCSLLDIIVDGYCCWVHMGTMHYWPFQVLAWSAWLNNMGGELVEWYIC